MHTKRTERHRDRPNESYSPPSASASAKMQGRPPTKTPIKDPPYCQRPTITYHTFQTQISTSTDIKTKTLPDRATQASRHRLRHSNQHKDGTPPPKAFDTLRTGQSQRLPDNALHRVTVVFLTPIEDEKRTPPLGSCTAEALDPTRTRF